MNRQNALLSGLISIILGVLFIIFKAEILNWMMIGLGVLLIVMGVLDIVNKNLIPGIVLLIVGILTIILSSTIIWLLLYILGVLLMVLGIVLFVQLFNTKRKYRSGLLNFISFLVPVFYILIGICLCFNQTSFINTVYIIVGVLLIVQGTLNVVYGAMEAK